MQFRDANITTVSILSRETQTIENVLTIPRMGISSWVSGACYIPFTHLERLLDVRSMLTEYLCSPVNSMLIALQSLNIADIWYDQ